MAMQAAADINVLICSDNTSSERRISPAWTLSQFKDRLESITGVPNNCQKLEVSQTGQEAGKVILDGSADRRLESWALKPMCEIYVQDTRPPGLRPNYTDVSSVPKYEMPEGEYESRTDSVLAWKKAQKLGRFDPNAPSAEEQKIRDLQREVEERGIATGKRCCLLPESDQRRGVVSFVGAVEQIPGIGAWVGVTLDEPTGKNDGSVNGKAYFQCVPKHGVFVRPERVEIGDFPPLDDLGEDMEEI